MPRRAKGPRLYFRTGRTDSKTGRALPDVWVIRDGQTQISTGCGYDRLSGPGGAEEQLAAYIASKWAPEAGETPRSRRDPAQVGVAEVLALYAMERAPELAADPVSTAGFIQHLTAWWGSKYLVDVKRSTCRAYVEHRCSQVVGGAAKRSGTRMVSVQTARRELETLSSAIGYWHAEDTLTTRPKVWLPEKAESPREALTRAQAARLLMAARGYRITDQVHPSGRPKWQRLGDGGAANRAHLKRFVVLGYYVGSRSAVNLALLWSESPIQAWVDLDKGMIWRRGKQEKDRANKRRPVVKIPRRLLAHMRRWKAQDERRSEKRKHPINAVIHHGGEPISTKVNKGFNAMVRDAGLPEEVTPHWLRHTCATWLMEAGVEMWEAAAFTGMTVAVLEKHYGHHRPDFQANASRAAGWRG